MPTDRAPTNPTPKMSRAVFARLVGKSKGRITEACKTELAAAGLPDGSLNPLHPAIEAYCVKRGIDFSVLRSSVGAVISANKSIESSAAPSDIELQEIERILQPLNERFGSVLGLQDWLRARKITAEVARLESRNRRDDGRIISRAGVEHFVFGFLERLSLNLLQNMPTALQPRLQAMVRNGQTREEQVAVMREYISTELKNAQRSIVGALKSGACQVGDNPEPTASEKDSQNA